MYLVALCSCLRCVCAPREALIVDSVHSASSAQAERWTGALLQRSDCRAGEKVRDAEISLTTGKETPGQDAPAERKTGINKTKIIF